MLNVVPVCRPDAPETSLLLLMDALLFNRPLYLPVFLPPAPVHVLSFKNQEYLKLSPPETFYQVKSSEQAKKRFAVVCNVRLFKSKT